MRDYTQLNVRSAAILTTSYVAGTIIEGAPYVPIGIQEQNQMVIYFDFTKGSLTSAELKIEFGHVLAMDLPYDGQSANFTVGKVVKGDTSGAFGEILYDTDSGATGTLVLAPIKGTFIDNETIRDDNGTPGVAVVNGSASTSTFGFYQETSSSVSSGTSTDTVLVHTFTATGKYRIAAPLLDRYVRISVKGTGTTTSSSAKIIAAIGRV